MEISKEEIIHLANLSKLKLSDEETEKFKSSLQDIVEFAGTINELSTDGVEELSFIQDSFNVFRKDEVKKSLDREELLKNAPSSNGEAYSIPSMQ